MDESLSSRREYQRAYREANKEQLAEKKRIADRRRYAENPERYREENRRKYHANPEPRQACSDRWKEENKEDLVLKRKAQYTKRKQEAREVSAFIGARNRARMKGLEFTITREWLDEQPKHCVLSGMLFRPEYDGVHGRNPFAPSIDRIDSNKGYTPDNSRVILSCLNMGLGQWGLAEVLPIWKAVIAHQEDSESCV